MKVLLFYMKNNVFVLRADFGLYSSTFEKVEYIGIGWFEVDPKREVYCSITCD
jgi:capsid protein